MASEIFHVGDLVWAKMRGYSPWPAKIVKPKHDTKPPKNKKAHHVYFFGTKDFAWILDENITPHSKNFLNNMRKKKFVPYQKAIEDFIIFSKCRQKYKQRSPKRVKSSKPRKGSEVFKKGKEIVPKKKQKIVPDKEKKSPRKKKVLPRTVKNTISGKVKRGSKYEKEKELPGTVKGTISGKKKRGSTKEKESDPRKGTRRKSGNGVKSQTKIPKVNISKKKEKRKRPIDEEPNECTCQKKQKFMVNEDPLLDRMYHYLNSDIASASIQDNVTEELDKKHVIPTKKKIGFIGLGHIGKGIIHNLLKSGHDVSVWNRTTYKCAAFIEIGAKKAQSPAELILTCDTIFCSVSGPEAAKSIIFGDYGILKGLNQAGKSGNVSKGYVEMTSIDPETSKENGEVIARKGCRYLEAPICGDSKNAVNGTLSILASGNRDLFVECETCFHAMGSRAYFVSCNVGLGSKMSLLLSMYSGTLYAALAEALVLAKRLGLSNSRFLTYLCRGPLQCQSIIEMSRKMMQRDLKTVTPLKHVQKDLNITLSLANQLSQDMPLAAAANEVYKHAKRLQYSDFDVSTVCQGLNC